MKLYSTNNKGVFFSFKEAVLKGLPDDNGLFMPSQIPVIESDFWKNIHNYSFKEIAFRMASNLIGDSVPSNVLGNIIEEAINFPAPVVSLDNDTSV